MDENIVIVPVYDDKGKPVSVKRYKLIGHEVAFCKDKLEVESGGISLAEKTREYCCTAVVIGVGPKVGQPVRNKGKRSLHGWSKSRMDLPLKKGDRVLLPDGCDSISHPFAADYEGLIHCNDIIAIVEGME